MINSKDFSSMSFEDVKSNLIQQFKNTEEFKDYEFSGSRLNILLDVLTYATIFQGAY